MITHIVPLPLESDVGKEFVRMVLHQAFGSGEQLSEVFTDAWCLGEASLQDWNRLRNHMLVNGLMRESGEEEYFRITDKGQDVLGGEDY